MNSPFVAIANPPPKGAESAVANDGFWPDVDCEQLRRDKRLDGTVTAERLRDAIESVMWAVNAELAAWQAEQLAAGHASLAEVPAPMLGGESIKAKQYRRAIYAGVQSELAEAYRDMDILPDGLGKEGRVRSKLELRVDGFNTNMRHAIADLLGKPRVIAELL